MTHLPWFSRSTTNRRVRPGSAFLAVAITVTAVLPAHAANKTWTNGAGTGLWATGSNWNGNTVPATNDDLKLRDDGLSGTITGSNFLSLGGLREVSSIQFFLGGPKYIWANPPTSSATTARQLWLSGSGTLGGIDVTPNSGPVFLGNAGLSASGTQTASLALRVETSGTYLNRSASDLTIGTPYGAIGFDAATGVGGTRTPFQTGARIGGSNSADTSRTLTLETSSSGNIVVNGLIDSGGTDRSLSLVVKRPSGTGIVYFNNGVQNLAQGAFEATVTIESGVLSLGSGIATSSTAAALIWPASINTGAQLIVNRTSSADIYGLTAANIMSGGGGVAIEGGSVVSVQAAQQYTGGTDVANGFLQLADGGSLAGGVAVAAGSTFNVIQSENSSFPHAITGAGQVTKDGSGTWTLTGNNSYSGPTSVNNGRLIVSGTNSGTGAVSVNANGIIGGAGTLGGALSFASGSRFLVDVSDGLPLTVNGATVDFFSGFGIANLIGIDSGTDLGLYPLFAGSADILTANLANLGPANPLPLGDGKSAYFVNGSGLGVQVVPEPASLALTAMALAGLAVGAIRRRKAAVKKG